jgi:hypothetical protein
MSYTCDRNLPFHECELALLRNAVDKAEDIKGYEEANSIEIKKMIQIVETFIKDEKLICYGGTAINNILPKSDQFYDMNKEIPDYDFFSSNALKDAKKLADIYKKEGYVEIEAKAGQHYGTYKVFVNFTPIADITQVNHKLFNTLFRESIVIKGIRYLPPNMLRMSMYLELSRPAGDISRWEKVLKRLTLLNDNYPLKAQNCDYDFFSRKIESKSIDKTKIFHASKNYLIDNNCVFFGGFAHSVFMSYMNKSARKSIKEHPDFDVLSTDAKETAYGLKALLNDKQVNDVHIFEHKNVDEIVPTHYQIKIGKDTIAFIYNTIACYSYNTVNVENSNIRIATIDTMLSLYLAFIYTKRNYYDTDRILCMANFLFKIQQKNRLKQKGPLKRFTINCYGTQPTKQSMRKEKADKFVELKDNRGTKEYEEWFLNYNPVKDNAEMKKKVNKKTKKVKKNHKKTAKRSSMKNIRKSFKKLFSPI